MNKLSFAKIYRTVFEIIVSISFIALVCWIVIDLLLTVATALGKWSVTVNFRGFRESSVTEMIFLAAIVIACALYSWSERVISQREKKESE